MGWKVTTLSGTIDGSNTAFTVPFQLVAEGARVYINGQAQYKVALSPAQGEYTLSGTTVTFGVAPVSGDRVWLKAREQ